MRCRNKEATLTHLALGLPNVDGNNSSARTHTLVLPEMVYKLQANSAAIKSLSTSNQMLVKRRQKQKEEAAELRKQYRILLKGMERGGYGKQRHRIVELLDMAYRKGEYANRAYRVLTQVNQEDHKQL